MPVLVDRVQALHNYAKMMLDDVNRSRCDAFADIVREAALLVDKYPDSDWAPHERMLEDLKKVLVGNGFREGRGKGPYFVGNYRGASGFRPELRDPYNQIQHAMGGILFGYHHWAPLEWFVLWREHEPQDDILYERAFALGDSLDETNYGTLWLRLYGTICGCSGDYIQPDPNTAYA